MPNTTEGLLLVIGGLFLMIALIGGGFEISAAKIPPVGSKGRIGSAVAGLVFLAIAGRSIVGRDQPAVQSVAAPVVPASSPPVTTSATETKAPEVVQEPPRTPIDNLFKAWGEKDLEGYLDQWHRRGRQWVGKTPRSLPEIAERRRKDFERYQRVQVIDHKVEIENATVDPVTARVTYSMRFQKPDGTWVNETDFRETYKLTFLKDQNRWVILENFDYFAK